MLIDNVWYEQRQGPENEPDTFTPIDNKSRAVEMLITGMRTVRGAALDAVRDAVNMDFVENNPDLVEIANGRIRATKKGLLILDNIMLGLAL